ncbi:Hypothetical predicted protein [Olea europaea subsp. europaea]|uniref:Uncharacterized protein n=1 Tax=Olea europaea subsp. europaea TaxID=158383 RepID=A0A8S0RQG9_OLEEU|nr:Hypothetical predicted protein [Olea europaea subsp. europaea]
MTFLFSAFLAKSTSLKMDNALSKFFSNFLLHVIDEVNFAGQEIVRFKGNRTVLVSEDEMTSDHGVRLLMKLFNLIFQRWISPCLSRYFPSKCCIQIDVLVTDVNK